MVDNVPQFVTTSDLNSADFDSIVVVAPNVVGLPFKELTTPLQAYLDVDKDLEKGVFVVPSSLPSKKIVFSGTGPLDNDFDDVRR